jgi:hypothetical protein
MKDTRKINKDVSTHRGFSQSEGVNVRGVHKYSLPGALFIFLVTVSTFIYILN